MVINFYYICEHRNKKLKAMKLKSVLIVSSFFAPENTPRAFRVTALAQRLAARGAEVTVLLPNKQIYHNSGFDSEGVELIFANTAVEPAEVTMTRKSRGSLLPKWIKEMILFFVSHEYIIKYNRGIERRFSSLEGDFDLILSVSYPVAIHRAVVAGLRKNRKLKHRVLAAEFSDPPFHSEYWQSIFPYYKHVMRRWGKRFDYFITPTDIAVECYQPYMPNDRIKVIPQGFDLSGVELHEYRPNSVPTFAYAGRFYEKIRDPEFLFKYLCSLDIEFCFKIYANISDPYFDAMVSRYEALSSGRIVRCEPLGREQLIAEISSMDFLVNLEYTTKNATPIKLIDYGMARRPIISFRESNFDASKFRAFLSGDYSDAVAIDLSPFDIDRVCSQFEGLLDV